MAKLSDDLKRMLAGLAYQHAGEFLSTSEKMKVLNGNSQTSKISSQSKAMTTLHEAKSSSVEIAKFATRQSSNIVTTKHIAFISNGEGINAPLDYAIESSQRQNAQIDLLIHDADDPNMVTALENKIRAAGVHFQRIQIKDNAVEKVVDYVVKQSSLIFIIATPVDTVAKTLIEEVSPKDNNHIHVPFVLIKDEITPNTLEQTAA